MAELDQEKDNIILMAIASRGFDAVPLDYLFLKRYALLNIYYELVDSTKNGLSTKELELVLKSRAKSHIDHQCSFEAIKTHRNIEGDKQTKAFLLNNPIYWRMFLNKIKKIVTK